MKTHFIAFNNQSFYVFLFLKDLVQLNYMK